METTSQIDTPQITTRLPYNKTCNFEDFYHADYFDLTREIHPHNVASWPEYPTNHEWRKDWEVTMTVRALRDFGALRPDARILGVAAGHEVTMFYLTHHVQQVVATDLYSNPGDWKDAAPKAMLKNPEQFALYPYQHERLKVLHMNALNLEFEDNSFDGIFCTSSIEHFGDFQDIAQAAREMGRVLKPGGILSLTTEYRLQGPSGGHGKFGMYYLSTDEIQKYIIQSSGLSPIDEISTFHSPKTLNSVYPVYYVSLRPVGWSPYPNIVLSEEDYVFSPIHLALVKPNDYAGSNKLQSISDKPTKRSENQLKVMHITTQNEPCGIADYAAAYIDAMNHDGAINKVFPVSPNILRNLPKRKFIQEIDKLCESLSDCDILHFQHEYSFYSPEQINYMIQQVRVRTRVKIVATLHTAPPIAHLIKPSLFSPREWRTFRASYITRQNYLHRSTFLRQVDMLIVHNEFTRKHLELEFNIDPKKIALLPIPVKPAEYVGEAKIVKFVLTELNLQPDDFLLCTVGFLAPVKGIEQVIKALTCLPENYKLLVIGGIHPKAGNDIYLDGLFELARHLHVEHRVCITGYVSKEEQIALLNICYASLFAYQRGYPSSSAAISNALSAGLPIITTPIPSFQEINDRVKCLQISPDFSYYSLARTIREVATDSEVNESLKSGMARYIAETSTAKMALELRSVYGKVAAL